MKKAGAETVETQLALARQTDKFVQTTCRDPKAFAVIVEGDRMEPTFRDGDRVVFAPGRKPKANEAVLAKFNDGRLMFAWYELVNGRVVLSSDNPALTPVEVAPDDLQYVFPAVELHREIKRRVGR